MSLSDKSDNELLKELCKNTDLHLEIELKKASLESELVGINLRIAEIKDKLLKKNMSGHYIAGNNVIVIGNDVVVYKARNAG